MRSPDTYRRLPLDVFLHCTLGGFAEDDTITYRERLRRLWDRGLSGREIGELIGSSTATVCTLASRWAFPYRQPRGRLDRMKHGNH